MDRRDFIRNGALSAAVIVAAKKAMAASPPVAGGSAPAVDLDEKTIAELHPLMAAGHTYPRPIPQRALADGANFRSSHASSGWSGRGGQAKNPYVLDRNPCGSSSGSGAAVAANLCAAAIGTETDGSVVCPSSSNGIVGIKPTLGLLSRSGIIPIAHSQDTDGPMAPTQRG